MAFKNPKPSTQPAIKDKKIVFEFGVDLSDTTKSLATTSNPATLLSSGSADYICHLARRKLAETKRKADVPERIAEHFNAGLATSVTTTKNP